MKYTGIDISRNPSENFNQPDLQDCVKFTRMHYHDFDILANIEGIGAR